MDSLPSGTINIWKRKRRNRNKATVALPCMEDRSQDSALHKQDSHILYEKSGNRTIRQIFQR